MTTIYTHDTLFKVLDEVNHSMHGGSAIWTPGEWQPWIEDIVPCRRGYHLCKGARHLVEWIGPVIWTAESQGEAIEHDGTKLVVHQARIMERVETWNERAQRLFACDCAEHVLRLFEDEHPDDDRPRQAIEVARRYANGAATDSDRTAAGAAAWAAAGAAAWATARDAAWEAAWDAAGDAAWDAAWAAARAAARGAARGAAWAARGAAWAARDAAIKAERQWQADRLLAYLNGEVA